MGLLQDGKITFAYSWIILLGGMLTGQYGEQNNVGWTFLSFFSTLSLILLTSWDMRHRKPTITLASEINTLENKHLVGG